MLFIGGLIFLIIILIIMLGYGYTYLKKKRLINAYGFMKPTNYHELTGEYYNLCPSDEIDDNTYHDFELDTMFDLVDANYTGIGKEFLYSLFFNGPKYHDLQEFIIKKIKNKKLLSKLLYQMHTLGRAYFPILDVGVDLAALPYYYAIIVFVMLSLFLISIVIATLGGDYFSFILLSIITNIMINTKLSQNTNRIDNQITLLTKMVHTGKKIVSYKILSKEEAILLQQSCSYLNKKLLLNKICLHISKIDIFSLFETIKSIFFIELIQCFLLKKNSQKVFEHVLIIYKYIGVIDVALSVNVLRNNYDTCIPIIVDKKEIQMVDGYHPLIKNPVKNSIIINNNILITGSNASGKSTFLKVMGVNMIFARSINTVFATEFKYQPLKLVSSIHMRDSILKGESYYVREIQVLKKITDQAKRENCLILIDEILKGTNEKERIKIAKAILQYLFHTDSIAIISTHDLHLLEGFDTIDTYCFNDIQKDTSIVYDYKLKKGICTTGNAIKLVKILGFDEEITKAI